MKAGSTWQLFVPADLARGKRQFNRIPPNSTLIFGMEMLPLSNASDPGATVPESAAIKGLWGGTAIFAIVNGTPPYTISSNDGFPPVPATVGASGGKFSVRVKPRTSSQTVTYTITDSASATVTATLNIT